VPHPQASPPPLLKERGLSAVGKLSDSGVILLYVKIVESFFLNFFVHLLFELFPFWKQLPLYLILFLYIN
jgi:hypothetical protein